MGVDRWMYLGPYAEIPVTLKTTKRDNCPQRDICPNPTSGPFCPQCGIQVSNRFHEFQTADPPIPDFLYDELGEALHTADGSTGPERIGEDQVIYRLLGNQRRPEQPREFLLQEGHNLHIDVLSMDPKAEIEWFKKAFAPEWMKVQQTYGGIIFRWGFLQWFW